MNMLLRRKADDQLRGELRAILGRGRPSKPIPDAAGRTITHYELLREIGAGSKGVVYVARDLLLGRLVAVKMLRSEAGADAGSRQRFLREARCASALGHPNIVTVHEMGDDQGTPFLVMEYVRGQPLDRVIPKRGLLLGACLNYAIAMARALAAIHQRGMVHRDLKPSNFVIASGGGVKLLDFGLAKPLRPSRCAAWNRNSKPPETREGTIMGTAGYMSPEQVRGRAVDRRSDIFSCGAILHEMLTGRRAFEERSTVETMSAILLKDPPRLPPRIPPPLAAVARRCLEKNPADRYKTGAELLAELTRVAEHLNL